MNDMQPIEEEEISLFDLYEKLRKGWRSILGGVFLGLGLSGLAIVFTSPRYEALAMLQAGRVAGTVVEEPTIIAERLKSPALLLEIARAGA